MHPRTKAFQVYKRAILILGLLVLIAALRSLHIGPNAYAELAFFFIIVLLAELFPIKVPGTDLEFAMTMPVVIALFISHGSAAMICVSAVAILAAFVILLRRRGWGWGHLAEWASINAAIYIVSVAVAWIVYRLVGTTLADGKQLALADFVVPLLVWVLVCTTVNMVLFATAVSLYYQESWKLWARRTFDWYKPSYVTTWPSAILFSYLYMSFGIYGILLIIIPFFVGREALRQYATQRDAYLDTITTLGYYMQQYHAYTKGHLERVADMADQIANEMRLPLQSLMYIREAGQLHDIGKVGVSEEVLDKVGKLSDEDWKIIRQHPARGAEILKNLKHLEPIVPWVRGHHERPDGKGYPDGLVYGDIPIEAAVLAVADAFDAMVGGPEEKDQRVYRVPLTIDQAMEQVRLGAGTQFDSRVVKAFIRVMARKRKEETKEVVSSES